jgi:hypothetical protein
MFCLFVEVLYNDMKTMLENMFIDAVFTTVQYKQSVVMVVM